MLLDRWTFFFLFLILSFKGHLPKPNDRRSCRPLSRGCFGGRVFVLCHLSGDNNRPDVAVRTHKEILGEDFPVYVASRHEASHVFEV